MACLNLLPARYPFPPIGTDLVDVEYLSINGLDGYTKEETLEAAKFFLDNYRFNSRPLKWYSRNRATYQGTSLFLMDIVKKWNGLIDGMEKMEERDDSLDVVTHMFSFQSKEDGYALDLTTTIEHVCPLGSHESEERHHYDIEEKDAREVLGIMYSTGRIEDMNEYTIYCNCSLCTHKFQCRTNNI